MNVHQYQEQRAAKVSELRALGNDLTGDKATRFDTLEAEVRAIDVQIGRAARLAEIERQADAAPDQNQNRELRTYSVAKALREAASGNLTGLERERHDELSRGREARGVMIPTAMILEARAMLTTGSAGVTVPTNVGPLVDRHRPTLAVQSMGATVLTGLVGNLDLPKLTDGPTAHWIAEDQPTTASDATFSAVSLSPKTVSGEMYLSRRLTLQNSVALEDVLRRDLGFVLAQALDRAAIQGGGANEPVGIIESVDPTAVLGTDLSDIAADLIAALSLDDVTGTAAFLTNPRVLAAARKIKDADGRSISVGDTFHSERMVSSNNVPAIAGIGGEPATYPLIYGHWADLVVAYWSGVDILANPYSDASKGGLRLHAFLDADVAVRHDEAFAWAAV